MSEHPDHSGLRQSLCEVGRALYEHGLIAGRAGNLSVALDDRYVLITPQGVRKDRLRPDELLLLPWDGPDPTAPAPVSSEWRMHLACYGADPARVKAVVHAHPPALTAAGIRRLDLPAVLPEITAAVGELVLVDFEPSGSEALAKAAADAVNAGAAVLLLERHGATAVGRSLEEAFDRIELAELAAKAVVMSAS